MPNRIRIAPSKPESLITRYEAAQRYVHEHEQPNLAPVHVAPSFAYKGGNTLREYQCDGVNWLIDAHHAQRSMILADEMGLGKTVQSLCFLAYLQRHLRVRGPFLIVAPLATIGHWCGAG